MIGVTVEFGWSWTEVSVLDSQELEQVSMESCKGDKSFKIKQSVN